MKGDFMCDPETVPERVLAAVKKSFGWLVVFLADVTEA